MVSGVNNGRFITLYIRVVVCVSCHGNDMDDRFNWLDFWQMVIVKEYKYTCDAGEYTSDSLWGLIFEILKHRTWHLFKHGKWID